MPRRVGNDEFPPCGGEIAVGDVDGNALFAFRDQTVGQQREVECLASFPRGPFDRGKLVGKDRLGIVEQPSNQRALAVIDASRGQESQDAVIERFELVDRRHQK